jgi:hypothetical protein
VFNMRYFSVFCVNKSSHSFQYKVCWTLLEDLFTQNTGKYFMLNAVGRLIYTKYWEIPHVEHCWKIYWHKILAQHKVFPNFPVFCVNKSSTVFNIKYFLVFSVNKSSNSVQHKVFTSIHKILRNTLCWTLGRFIYTKYWEIPYVEHCGKIYSYTILVNTLCWTL